MIKVDLITGFLGSGKTTFIKKYARYLLDKGQKIGIIENDFGAVNVDMLLLSDIMGENCELEMISGGCDRDCHRRRFKTKLIAMGMCGYDRVLLEPSGIFDTEEFFDILNEEPLDKWYEIGNVIAIANAGLFENLSDEEGYLMTSQIAAAGKIILSHVNEVSEEKTEETLERIKGFLEKFKCGKNIDNVVMCKEWDRFTEEDFEDILKCGFENEDYEKLWFENEDVFNSVYFMNVHMTVEELEGVIGELFKDKECGRIIRVKGFMRMEDEGWIEVNAVEGKTEIRKVGEGQEVLIVIGRGVQREKIVGYFCD